MRREDLKEAWAVVQGAFAHYLETVPGRVPGPLFGGARYLPHRWEMEPEGCFVAEASGRIVGANIAVAWGSCGLFGPMAVHPEFQGKGIAQKLLEPTMDFFRSREVRLRGLVTFPHSTAHIHLYQKFGYRPKNLVAVTSKNLSGEMPPLDPEYLLSRQRQSTEDQWRNEFRSLTGSLCEGLDVTKEIEATHALRVGETIFMGGSRVAGLAVCHLPPGSEAPLGNLYVKFLTVSIREDGPRVLGQLLEACERLAWSRGLRRVIVPVYTGYWAAYQTVLARGYTIERLLLRMKSSDEGEDPRLFLLDDWR
ncbi:MAG: GNAT family N-acetyltransferase [Acidobacteria bacterium]|nr:GNAT family N-acetyltransferase [Acidobacteriota bacterium]